MVIGEDEGFSKRRAEDGHPPPFFVTLCVAFLSIFVVYENRRGMKKCLFFLMVIVAATFGAAAQDVERSVTSKGSVSGTTSGKPSGKAETTVESRGTGEHRWTFTGNLGFDFGGSYQHLSISPQVGYALTNYFTLGGGMNYNFYNNSDNDYSRHSLGLNVYARFYILKYITLHAQPEYFVNWRKPELSDSKKWSAAMLVGAGITFPVAPGNYLSAIVYYDLLQQSNSPYGKDMFYSIGYGFRF